MVVFIIISGGSFVCRFGRKMSFMMSNLLNGITGILVAVAPNYVALLVFRTLYGFGVKGGWVAGYVLSIVHLLPLLLHPLHTREYHSGSLFDTSPLLSQSQRSSGWSSDAQWESFTRCSSASASSSSLCSPTSSRTGAGCRSSSAFPTSSSSPTTGD